MSTELETLPTLIVPEVERCFDLLNHSLFEERLVRPLVRVSLKKRPQTRVRFYSSGGSFDLVIGCGISEGTLEEFLQDLLHEMVHVGNYILQVTDCTSNQYHNQTFRDAALAVGLFVQRHKTRGWGVTSFRPFPETVEQERPDPARVKAREQALASLHFDRGLFHETQQAFQEAMGASERKQFQYKYVCQCPPPHNSIRCGRRPDGPRPLVAKCLRCNHRYVLAQD